MRFGGLWGFLTQTHLSLPPPPPSTVSNSFSPFHLGWSEGLHSPAVPNSSPVGWPGELLLVTGSLWCSSTFSWPEVYKEHE